MGNLAEFERYLEHLCEVLGHVDRSSGLKDYCRGLMLPIARKSVEPLAACSPTRCMSRPMRQAIATGVPMGVVLADAGYGDETAFRDGITELGMLYAVGIRPGIRYGHRELRRCRPNRGPVAAYDRHGCGESRGMNPLP